MTDRHYYFRSMWRVDAPIEKVWQVLTATPFSWQAWWPQIESLRDIETKSQLVGTSFRCTWRAPLGYRLRCAMRVEEAVPMHKIVLSSHGDLIGMATWRLQKWDHGTQLTIDWQVKVTKSWITRVPWLGWVYQRSHDYVMRSGERGLSAYCHEVANSTLLPN